MRRSTLIDENENSSSQDSSDGMSTARSATTVGANLPTLDGSSIFDLFFGKLTQTLRIESD